MCFDLGNWPSFLENLTVTFESIGLGSLTYQWATIETAALFQTRELNWTFQLFRPPRQATAATLLLSTDLCQRINLIISAAKQRLFASL